MKTVIISGASTGIGLACAQRMDSLGWRVLAGVRKEADAEMLREAGLEPVFLDVTKPEHIAALKTKLAGERVDGLVNNAGIAIGGPAEFIELDEYRRQFEVNLFGQIGLTQAFLEPLRASQGCVVNMSSMGGKLSQAFLSPYTASKHALEGWSDALRQEMERFGVRVAIVEPGAIATPIWNKGKGYADALKGKLNPAALELYGSSVDVFVERIERQNSVGIAPEAVADAVEHALTSTKPRIRYPVGRDAKIALLVRRLVTDRAMDRLIRRSVGARKRKRT